MAFLSIGSKLLTMLLLAGMLGVAAAGLVADYYGSAALQAAIFNQLTTVRENKREQMVDYFEGLRREFRLLSETPTTMRAFTAFSDAYHRMSKLAPATELASPKLVKFYRDVFLPKLAHESEGTPSLDAYLPTDSVARRLQTDYIADNPFPYDEKQKFLVSSRGGLYDQAHAEFHPFFLEVASQVRIDDVMLIDVQGDVVYSLSKEVDFATNLRTGPYSRTGEARAFERALDLRDPGAIAFEPFAPYPPEGLAPAAFLSAPLVENGAVVGAILVQISTHEIDRIMTSDHKWAEVGLGKTGSAYLVGSDRRALSDDRYFIEDKAAYLKSIAAAGVDRETIARIDAFNTMILNQPVDTEASRAALRGESGTAIIRDYRNEWVLSSWAPLTLPGMHWAIIAEMDTSEAFAPQHAFRLALLVAAAVTTIILTLFSFLGAGAFVRPIRAIMSSVKAFGTGTGDGHVRIPVHGHDEFSELAQGFNSMAEEIETRNARIREKTEEYERLLKNVYPDVVAERVKIGQTSISDVIQNVSVIVLNIDGVNSLLQSKDHNTVAVLNEIIDAFDAAAARFGVEKVKTLGESYFAACGLSTPRLDHATRAVAFAEECCRILTRLSQNWNLPLELRAGVASGEVTAGLIGRRCPDQC